MFDAVLITVSLVAELEVVTITAVLERDMVIDTKNGFFKLDHRLINHNVIWISTEFRL